MVALVWPLCVHAGDPLAVSLDSMPLFAGVASNPKEAEAAQKFQQAFFLQTGITQTVDQTKSVMSKLVTEKSTKAIETVTPFKAKDVFFVVGTAYAVGVKKEVVQKFKDPFFPSVTHVVSVGRNSGSMFVNVPF